MEKYTHDYMPKEETIISNHCCPILFDVWKRNATINLCGIYIVFDIDLEAGSK